MDYTKDAFRLTFRMQLIITQSSAPPFFLSSDHQKSNVRCTFQESSKRLFQRNTKSSRSVLQLAQRLEVCCVIDWNMLLFLRQQQLTQIIVSPVLLCYLSPRAIPWLCSSKRKPFASCKTTRHQTCSFSQSTLQYITQSRQDLCWWLWKYICNNVQ